MDSSESELGILDLIQVFVESLDKRFENVCELDLIFHVEKVHHIMDEIVMGGMVLETSMNEILTHVDAKNALVKKEGGNVRASMGTAGAAAKMAAKSASAGALALGKKAASKLGRS